VNKDLSLFIPGIVERAEKDGAMIKAAASKNGVDPNVLAAIGAPKALVSSRLISVHISGSGHCFQPAPGR